MHVDDVRVSGWWPLQDHDTSKPLGQRATMGAVRVTPNETDSDTDPTKQTQGDIRGGFLWEAAPGGRAGGAGHAWWLTGAGVVSTYGGESPDELEDNGGTRTRRINVFADGPTIGDGGSSAVGWLPLRGPDAPDVRFGEKAPALPSFARDLRFPRGWTAQASAGSDEDSQREILHPDGLGLVAVNLGGDPRCGSLVYDTDAKGNIVRSARVQSAWSVVRLAAPPPLPGVPTPIPGVENEFLEPLPGDPATPAIVTGSLAWQIGAGGRIDGGLADGLLCDHTTGEVGFAQARRGGFLTLGGDRGCTKHTRGVDEDGNRISVGHIDAAAPFILSGDRDGPLALEPRDYPEGALELPILVHGHTCFRPSIQAWQTYSSCAFYLPPPEEFIEIPGGSRPYPPPQPPPPPPPPGGDPPPFFPEGPGIGTIPGGGSGPRGPGPRGPGTSSGPGTYTGFPTGLPGDEFTIPGGGTPGSGQGSGDGAGSGDGTVDGESGTDTGGSGSFIDQWTGMINPLRPFGFPGGAVGGEGDGSEIGTIPGGGTPTTPTNGDGDTSGGRPTYPHSANCLVVPNIFLKATATAIGQLDPTGAAVQTPETLAAFNGAPIVGHWVGMGAGDGTWGGFTDTTTVRGYPTGAGTIMPLPGDVTAHEVIGGTATTASPLQIGVPNGFTELSFGTPNQGTGKLGSGTTCKGYAGGLLIGATDSDGELQVGGNQAIISGEGGHSFTGNTSITGNLSVSGKLDVAGRLDPTTLELTDQVTDDIPDGSAGFRFDSATDVRPLWKQKGSPYTETPIALLTDVTGAGGAWELVEAKTVTANSTTLTFSGLDGDTDSAYMLVWSIINNAGANVFYNVQPNGTTSNQGGTFSNWTTTFNSSTTTALTVGNGLDGGNSYGVAYFYAAKSIDSIARKRGTWSQGTYTSAASAASGTFVTSGIWNESSTNVTSIEFESDSANGIGDGSRVCLYKLVTA